MKKSLFAVIGLLLVLFFPASSKAEPAAGWVAEGVERGINSSGLTGLFLTNSAYTVGKGRFTLTGNSVSSSIVVTPISLTIGLSDTVEIAGTGKLFQSGSTTGSGDSDVYIKWRFKTQGEFSPAMALVAGVTLPSASNAIAQETSNMNTKLMLLASAEARLTETMAIGLYMDLQGIRTDWATTHYVANVGMMIPISDNDRLQFITEASVVSGLAAPVLTVSDGSSVIVGLRYASRSFKLSGGAEMGAQDNRSFINFGIEL